MSPSVTVQHTDMLLIVFGQQWHYELYGTEEYNISGYTSLLGSIPCSVWYFHEFVDSKKNVEHHQMYSLKHLSDLLYCTFANVALDLFSII